MTIFLYAILIILAGLAVSLVMPGFTDDLSFSYFLAVTAVFALSALVILLRKHIHFFKTLSVYIAIFLTLFIIAEGALIYFSGDGIPTGNEQAIIVAGGGLFVESRLTAELEERLDKAVEIYAENTSLPIILSGGTDENRTLPQAVAMKAYLEKQINTLGLDAPVIITEEESAGLYENITFSMKKAQTENIYIIVSRHNVPSAKIIQKKICPGATVIGAEYPISKYIIYYIREIWFTIRTAVITGLY